MTDYIERHNPNPKLTHHIVCHFLGVEIGMVLEWDDRRELRKVEKTEIAIVGEKISGVSFFGC